MDTKNDFSKMFTGGGDESPFAELPVKAAWLRWSRGNAELRAVKDSDPAKFLGGWKAAYQDKEGNKYPELPLPVVERVSQDGTLTFLAYASNVIEFLPIQHRTRFEMRETVKDPQTGRDVVKTIAVSKNPESKKGWTPVKQVFGLVFAPGATNSHNPLFPAVLYIDRWSNFISFNKADAKWDKVAKTRGDAVLVRRYGTEGTTDKRGNLVPNFEVFGQSRSTPIEAIGVNKPQFITPTDDILKLHYDSVDWKYCPRWNQEGAVQSSEPAVQSAMEKFMEKANEMQLTNMEVEQLLAEHKGNYRDALTALESGLELETANTALAAEDEFPY